jgi:hypothetical protein
VTTNKLATTGDVASLLLVGFALRCRWRLGPRGQGKQRCSTASP